MLSPALGEGHWHHAITPTSRALHLRTCTRTRIGAPLPSCPLPKTQPYPPRAHPYSVPHARSMQCNSMQVGSLAGCRSPLMGSLRGAISLGPGFGSTHGGRPERRMVAVRSAAGSSGLIPLGLDFLAFLATTVVVIPLFKRFKLSPILGFLASGVVLQQLGITKDLEELSKLSELGVLFLLFEMGLELSIDRLKALARYAFGIGSLQMLTCIGIFTLFSLPVGDSVGTHLLEYLAHAPHGLVSIRSVNEAVIIAAALSLSSSAFVLQLLSERGELTSRFGSATLGVLLFQDIAVVPFLVLLPLLESGVLDNGESPMSLVKELGPAALETLAGLGALLLSGRFILRRVFSVVVQSQNSETFVALCLLTVAGCATLTEMLGFSDTLGAFIAGVLLSETNFRSQVEVDIKPFRGLLLGLFFVTTGSSVDLYVLASNWQLVAFILAGLLSIKITIISILGRLFGLSGNEALRLGFTLSQGGEFAFVLLSLASSLHVLPDDLNQVLIIVVVLSMALTPALAEGGKLIADRLDSVTAVLSPPTSTIDEGELVTLPFVSMFQTRRLEEPVIICGFGLQGQMLANMLESPLVGDRGEPYIAFDMDPIRVQAARSAGFTVVYGDGSRDGVLYSVGVKIPKAIVVCHISQALAVKAVQSLRAVYADVPIFACGASLLHAAQLEAAGATSIVLGPTEAGLELGATVLSDIGVSKSDINALIHGIYGSLTSQTHTMDSKLSFRPAAPVELLVLDKELHAQRARERFGSNGPPPSSLSMWSAIYKMQPSPFDEDVASTAPPGVLSAVPNEEAAKAAMAAGQVLTMAQATFGYIDCGEPGCEDVSIPILANANLLSSYTSVEDDLEQPLPSYMFANYSPEEPIPSFTPSKVDPDQPTINRAGQF